MDEDRLLLSPVKRPPAGISEAEYQRTDQDDPQAAVEHPGQVFLRLVAALMRLPASRMPSCAELARAALGIMLRFVTWWIGAFLR
jgi:hypothetical protein